MPRTATVTAAARLGDMAAIGLSGLCMIHCLALPLAAAALPLAGVWAEAEWVHWAFALVAAPISLWTLTRHRARLPLALGLFGLACLFAGAAEFPTHEAETAVTVAGGLLQAVAHVLNWKRIPHVCAADRP